jgi:hypothetical protein
VGLADRTWWPPFHIFVFLLEILKMDFNSYHIGANGAGLSLFLDSLAFYSFTRSSFNSLPPISIIFFFFSSFSSFFPSIVHISQLLYTAFAWISLITGMQIHHYQASTMMTVPGSWHVVR